MRIRLPARRAAEAFDFEFRGVRYSACLSRFPDGRIAEAFASPSKRGSHVDTDVNDSMTLLSIALQYGVPVEAIKGAVCRDEAGVAAGFLGALIDAI